MKSFLPLNWMLPPASRIARGKTWPKPPGARRVRCFQVYRYDPEAAEGPRLDTYYIDRDECDPMVLDALMKIKSETDSSLTFRRSCREGVCGSCAMSIDGRNWLACTQPIDDLPDPIRVFPLNGFPVVKDLVVDQTHVLAQLRLVEPWIKADTTPERERLQTPEDCKRLDGYYECILCFCCTAGCPSYWWNADRYLGPAVLIQAYRWLVDSRDEAKGERLDALEDPFRLYRCHSIMNCTKTCPKGLHPARAIAMTKAMLLERQQ